MAVKLRLSRMGKKRQPVYKVVAADARSPRDGRIIEAIGLYNPKTEPATVDIKEERALYWLGVGAQPTTTVKNLLSKKGILLKRELLNKGLSEDKINTVFQMAKNLGGNLSDYTVWLLERSLKTMGLRVKAQNENAQVLAEYLYANNKVAKVYYPGLISHPEHELAKAQMKGFGGMLSFELIEGLNADEFQKKLHSLRQLLNAYP